MGRPAESRLFHAIVVVGLSFASNRCGGALARDPAEGASGDAASAAALGEGGAVANGRGGQPGSLAIGDAGAGAALEGDAGVGLSSPASAADASATPGFLPACPADAEYHPDANCFWPIYI